MVNQASGNPHGAHMDSKDWKKVGKSKPISFAVLEHLLRELKDLKVENKSYGSYIDAFENDIDKLEQIVNPTMQERGFQTLNKPTKFDPLDPKLWRNEMALERQHAREYQSVQLK